MTITGEDGDDESRRSLLAHNNNEPLPKGSTDWGAILPPRPLSCSKSGVGSPQSVRALVACPSPSRAAARSSRRVHQVLDFALFSPYNL
jgi:hypothetical protein